MTGQISENFLPLTEYSSKHKVSISTLRRRIKANDIQFRFDQGKYLIFDSEILQRPSPDSVNSAPRPSPKSDAQRAQMAPFASSNTASDELLVNLGDHSSLSKASVPSAPPAAKNEEPILTAANRLLTELKKAYTQILQEKEEQVLHLKEEVSDLKTLVRVLESENERHRRMQTENSLFAQERD